MGTQNLRKDRRFTVLRLLPDERRLIQKLGTGPEKKNGMRDRDTVLRDAIIDIVRKMKLPPVGERKPLRISMPTDLDEVLDAKVEETGHTKVSIIVAAARKFREEYPLKKSR